MNIKFAGILLVQFLLLLAGCSSPEKEVVKAISDAPSTMAQQDSCYIQINKELIGLLQNKEALHRQLDLSEAEALLITQVSTSGKPQAWKYAVIEKLIPIIADTTDLKISCTCPDLERARLGDLALLCIYQLEKFPFALALGRQWCTGGTLSENIMLPYNLIAYTNFERAKIKASYQAYYLGEERNRLLK